MNYIEEIIDTENHTGPIIGNRDGLNVMHCYKCGYAHLDPLPSADSTQDYYNQDLFYRDYSASDWFDKERRENQLGLWNPCYSYQASLFGSRRGRGVLDIGCGAGWFLRYWKLTGGLGVGIEPSEIARQASPVSSIIRKSVDDLLRLRSSYLPIGVPYNMRMSLVLEHIPNAREFLSSYTNLMCSGAKMMVIVPSDFNPLQNYLRTRHFISWQHPNYFTPKTLSTLMQSCGLHITHVSTTFPMELFILFGKNYIGNDDLGRWCHNKRLQFEGRFGVNAFRLYRLLYKVMGIGREVMVVGEKRVR
jgi:SAM-dependent methyltransferase